jgi:hypothetical protein
MQINGQRPPLGDEALGNTGRLRHFRSPDNQRAARGKTMLDETAGRRSIAVLFERRRNLCLVRHVAHPALPA